MWLEEVRGMNGLTREEDEEGRIINGNEEQGMEVEEELGEEVS